MGHLVWERHGHLQRCMSRTRSGWRNRQVGPARCTGSCEGVVGGHTLTKSSSSISQSSRAPRRTCSPLRVTFPSSLLLSASPHQQAVGFEWSQLVMMWSLCKNLANCSATDSVSYYCDCFTVIVEAHTFLSRRILSKYCWLTSFWLHIFTLNWNITESMLIENSWFMLAQN